MNITDGRPIVFFDLETTGTNIMNDRIVEISTVKIFPDGTRKDYTCRVNPEMHIPEEATAIHHISDADVANEKTFKQRADNLFIYLEGCDLGGYNIVKFDLPVLIREFQRAGLQFSTEGRRVVDAYAIFCRMEPRNLTAAYKFFCGKKLEGAHGAAADTMATVEVFEAQLKKYGAGDYTELPENIEKFPENMDELAAFCSSQAPDWVDANGRFKWRGNEVVAAFGRHSGTPLRTIAQEYPDFLRWILKADFPDDVKKIASDALIGKFPQKA